MMHELGMPHHMGFGLGAASDDELGALAARRGRGRARSPKLSVHGFTASLQYFKQLEFGAQVIKDHTSL